MTATAVPAPLVITVADILDVWIVADQTWKPSTRVGYRSVARFLIGDRIGSVRASTLTPASVRAAVGAWQADGAGPAVVAARFRVL